MAQIRWTEQAADDLEVVAEYIARDSVYYARLFVLDVLAAIKRLQQFPAMGHIVPETNKSHLREVLLGNYRIVYRHSSDVVEILTIYHGHDCLIPRNFELRMGHVFGFDPPIKILCRQQAKLQG
ncbi:MAG: type II toxin-antitoxin system RelE/ParE family toxin [Acidobacteria bacterium]|nr:type II toxin-antitoxin system RelE/ParE family toxin [Acidobacteriota bacterium]